VGEVDDPREHEANRVADQVMRGSTPDFSTAFLPPQLNLKCASCDEDSETKRVQFKRAGATETAAGEVPAIVHDVLRTPGQPLDAATRAFFEPRFGFNFGQVRVHTDEQAVHSARAIGARAYTVGQAIVFGRGAFAPGDQAGQHLLAHELAHVVQHHSVAQNGAAFGSSIVQRQPDAGSPQTPASAGKKYLILYDATDVEVKAQAEQTATDHGTTAHAFDPAKLGELTKREQPDVIMTFGHGDLRTGSISMGTGLRVFRGAKTITSELEKAGQTKPIHFVAQACSVGAENGLMDALKRTPSLSNYTFVSHATVDHVTRNPNIRVAGGGTLPVFLADRFQVELGFDKPSADQIVAQVFVRASDAEAAPLAPINTVLREISVLGFERFWELTKIEHPDVANDPAVLGLNMTKEARERFASGIAEFRARMLKAVDRQMKLRLKKPAAAPK
jgi:hypothetical protein